MAHLFSWSPPKTTISECTRQYPLSVLEPVQVYAKELLVVHKRTHTCVQYYTDSVQTQQDLVLMQLPCVN